MRTTFLLLFFALSSLCSHSQFNYELHNMQKELSLVESKCLTFEKDGTRIAPPAKTWFSYTLPFRIPQKMKDSKGYEFSAVVKSLASNRKFFGFKVYFSGGHEFKLIFHPEGNYYLTYTPSSAKEYTTIADWEALKTIKKGKGAENELSIKVDMKTINFLMNNKVFYSISKKEMEASGMPTNGGLATIMLYVQGEGDYLVKQIKTSIQPEILNVSYAPSDPSKKLVPFNEAVNDKAYSSITPVVTADENTIFFARKLENDRAERITRDENLEWSKPEIMPFPINRDKKNSSVESANSDGTAIYSRGVYENDKYFHGITQYKMGLDGKWFESEKSKINDFKNVNRYLNYNLSNDGKYLIVVADMKTGYGNNDIHIAFKQDDGSFSQPKNLGPAINSAAHESTAFLAPDNATLYFSTSGLPGYGDNDIFMSKRLDDTWTNWSSPINLGPTINSEAWDSYFTTSASGNLGIIASSKEGTYSALYYFELEKMVKPDPVVVLSGTVSDAETNEPLLTNVQVKGLTTKNSDNIITNPNNGRYSKVLLKGEKYEIIAEKEGYYPISELVDLTSLDEFLEVEKNLKLVKIKVGQVIRLNNIFFEFAKSNLMDESFEELDRLLKLMNDNPEMNIQISGHTDGVGSDDSNQKLSQDRSQSVVDYLTSKGINKSRIIAVGYGKSKPIASNDTEEGRALNRRVEFVILDTSK